jgi:hypothetical protein
VLPNRFGPVPQSGKSAAELESVSEPHAGKPGMGLAGRGKCLGGDRRASRDVAAEERQRLTVVLNATRSRCTRARLGRGPVPGDLR